MPDVDETFSTGALLRQWLRWEVIVRFDDIGVIVDNHCLNFLFLLQ